MGKIKYVPKLSERISHLELYVKDLEKSRNYYEKVIGLTVLTEHENSLVLSADHTSPLIKLHANDRVVDRLSRTTGLFHLAILLPSRAELGHTLKHLLASGYPLQGASDHQFSEAVYLSDPDGNGIELYADTDPEVWKQEENGWYVGGTYPMNVEEILNEAPPKDWNALSPNAKLGHMHLQVADLQEAETFYVDTLGLDIVAKDDRMLFVSKDGYHHHIGLNTWAGTNLPRPPKEATGLRTFTIILTNEEFTSVKEHLNLRSYPYNQRTSDEIELEDPSGNGILLKEY
ncbi:VOC family protein [Alteribacter aurantiacus]|uniref:VOC family protein n=1 Tax=Alteribacter aurantiacus TaxID=254410 RepID=UPI0003FCEB27|nr:VOC family protein [Alteribacter aurantiacus]